MRLSAKQLFPPLLLVLISAAACNLLRKSEPKSGLELLLQIETTAADRDRLVEQTIRTLERRADALGANVNLQRKDSDKIILRIGTTPDMERLKKVLLDYARMEFHAVVSPPWPSPVQTYPSIDEAKAAVTAGEEILPYSERSYLFEQGDRKAYVIVKAEPVIANEDVRDAQAVPSDGSYQITFSLKRDGARRLGEWTAANINNYLGVVLNKELKSIPYIRGQITDQGTISGAFTRQAAEDLALNLRAGSLPAPVNVLEEKAFGK